ncbi:hypothetical protein Klosneuvirus_3_140 [Klosneuvirus KNV1]|uniref:Uncharacterized protein n=1 Tax=Klosneuvirus KNV1 TaxID=1977640 RepID=A0A1V0SJV0_9VIRU|nr:hypothetical protein Klosneuvirus_3_140 [Klosneuvirus KNV1]
MAANPDLSGLFGWNNMAGKVPPKITPFESLFAQPAQEKQEIVAAIDMSGSTLYESSKAFDGKTFKEIYAEVISMLEYMLPPHKVLAWSSTAKILEGVELITYAEAVKNKIPVTDQIAEMNQGTEAANILPHVKGKTLVLVTDGSIPQHAITAIQQRVPTSGIGNVFLLIVPHIDEYKDMYSDKQNIEIDPRNNIKLSIPQAFSNRLATVIIYNYRKKAFEMIPELSAPWVDKTKPFSEQLNVSLPVLHAGDFLIKPNEHYKTFKLDKLIEWINTSPVDETVLNKMSEMGIKAAIRQQANEQQKNAWNACIQQIFNKALDEKVKQEYKEVEVPANAPMFDRLKIITQNENQKKKIEEKYREQFGKLCGSQLIDRVVAEFQNLAAAKVAQTAQNVNAFKTMATSDKFGQLAPSLPLDECGLCGNQTNVFKTISIPTKLIVQLKLCNQERIVPGKKGKQQVVKNLNLDAMHTALETYPAKLHYMNLCPGCCNTCLKNCHEPTDSESGISNLFPQNKSVNEQGITVINSRLVIFPFIAPDQITDTNDPNQPNLSFARQWLRGYLSSTIGLDPASDQTLLASLLFISSLATNKENAVLMFATEKSLLRGGKQDRYKSSAGRLFKPSADPISSEILTFITIVMETVEKMEVPIDPASNKLLLLCLLERKVSRLIDAKKHKDTATEKLTITLHKLHKGVFTSDKDKFGLTDGDIAILNASESVDNYKNTHPEDVERFITYFLVHHLNTNIQQISNDEKNLINLLGSTTIQDAAGSLYMHEDYLDKIIKRANMSFEDFMTLIPKYVAELANVQDKDKLNVLQKFL